MRVFLATYTRFNYFNLKKDFEEAIINGKWVEVKNLHLTFKFFGEIKKNELNSIIKELDNFKYEKSEFEVKGVDFFNTQSHLILFAKINQKEKILNLSNKLNKLFKIDNFKPHITLCRVKKYNKDKFLNLIEKYQDFKFGKFRLNLSLIESTLTKNGPIYKIIKEF